MLERLLPLAIFVALAILLFAGIRLNVGRNPEEIPSPLIGKPAPAFSLPSLRDGEPEVSTQALRGEPYLLNVWGSWCIACRDEHAAITALARSGRLPVIGLNWKDERSDALRWLAQFGDPYAQIAVDDGRAAIDWGVYGAPESFLVDADGVVRYKHVGPLTPEVIEREILARLEPTP